MSSKASAWSFSKTFWQGFRPVEFWQKYFCSHIHSVFSVLFRAIGFFFYTRSTHAGLQFSPHSHWRDACLSPQNHIVVQHICAFANHITFILIQSSNNYFNRLLTKFLANFPATFFKQLSRVGYFGSPPTAAFYDIIQML